MPEEKSEDTLLQEDPLDYVFEEDSFNCDPIYHRPEPGSQTEERTSLSGKLKNFCPTFFSSLSLWERDALEKSRWLQASTTLVKGWVNGGLDNSFPTVVTSTLPVHGDTPPSSGSGNLVFVSPIPPLITHTSPPQQSQPQLHSLPEPGSVPSLSPPTLLDIGL